MPILQQGHGQLTKEIKDSLFNLAVQFIGLCLFHILKEVVNILTFVQCYGVIKTGWSISIILQEVGDTGVS